MARFHPPVDRRTRQIPLGETMTGTFGMLKYASTDVRNPDFDGDAFFREWGRLVGSVHRHYQDGGLILCFSTECLHPDDRVRLRAMLEADPRNVGSVLGAVDERDRRDDEEVEAANARYLEQRDRAASVLPPAKDWLRRWYGIGGAVRFSRRQGLRLIDRRHDETRSLPLVSELGRDDDLMLGVKWLLLPDDRIPGAFLAGRLP